MFKIWNKKCLDFNSKKMTFLFEILLDEIVMNNAWRMRYCKSKCAEKQEVNSALLYESCLSDNTLLLVSLRVSLREVCAIDVWLSKGLSEVKVKHELTSCNPKCKKGEKSRRECLGAAQSQNYSSLMIICP